MATVQDPKIAPDGSIVMQYRETTPEEDNRAANEASLDGQVFDNVLKVARETGTFTNNVARDAAIRTCARGIVLVVRLLRDRNDATD